MTEVKLRGSAQLTIIDLTDGRRVTALVSPNKPTTVIYDPDTNTYQPDYKKDPLVLTPQLLVEGQSQDLIASAKSVRWAYQKNSFGTILDITESTEGFRLGTGSAKTLTISKNFFTTDHSIRIYCYITYHDTATNKDYLGITNLEIQKLTNGSSGTNALVGSLSNDAQYISVRDFSESTFSNVRTIFSIYDGTIDVTGNWAISKTETTGITGTLVGNTYTLQTFKGEYGEVRLTATRTGFPSITKVFSLVKVKHGADGSTTELIASAPVVKKNQEGRYSPSNLTFKALYRVGDSLPVQKAVSFKISESTSPDGTTYTQTYKSSNLEETVTYTPSPNVSLIKAEIFADVAQKQKIDEEVLPVILDGRDSVIPVISTPNGTISRNQDKKLIAKLDIYKGVNTVSGTFYQWYVLDPTSVGDANSGAGWKKLIDRPDGSIRGSLTSTLEVAPSQITGTDTFKVVSSFLGTPIKATIDFSDLTDPYTVTLLGATYFKNGEGSNTYTAKIYRGGEEIDSNLGNYKHQYKWSLYSKDGVKVPTFSKTGKQITLSRDELDSTGFLTVQVNDTGGTILGISKIDVTDLSDAILSGTQPSSTVEGQLWIDTSGGKHTLKVYKNGSWQIQHLDVTKLDEGLAKMIESITDTLGSIVTDGKLNLNDRIIIATNLSRIIGVYPATSTTLTLEALPDGLALDQGQVGDFQKTRSAARSLGINDNTPEMRESIKAWDALREYLHTLTQQETPAWDIRDSKKNIVLTVNGDIFRKKWLDYYNAMQNLQGVILQVPGPEGQSAVTAMLDNDSAVIPTDYQGGHGIYDAAVSSLLVYVGTRDVTKGWTFTEKHSTGLTVTLVKNKITVAGITTDTGWVDITGSADGYPSLTRRFTVTRQKAARAGADVEMKWLGVSTPTFSKDVNGAYSPATANLTSNSKVGNGVIYPYNAFFFIEESSNGVDYIEVFNNTGSAKSSHTYKPSKNLKAIRITLKEPGTNKVLDVQSITVVSDGRNGNDGYTPIKGVDYFDGVSSRLHLRYSDDGGKTFTANRGKYMGTYVDTQATDSEDPSLYTWVKTVGEDAKYYQLLLSGYVFKFSSTNSPDPANQTIEISGSYGGGAEGEVPRVQVFGIDSIETSTYDSLPAITTNYKYKQEKINEYSTFNYYGYWNVVEDTSTLTIGQRIKLQAYNLDTKSNVWILAVVSSKNTNTLGLKSKGLLNSDGTSTELKVPFNLKTSGIITPTDMGSYPMLEVVGTYAGITDRTFINRVRDGFVGAHGLTSYLTNSAHTIVTDSYGNGASYAGAVTELKISSGSTDETSSWSITAEYNPAYVEGTLSGPRFTTTKLKVDEAQVTLKATKNGKPTITQVFTLTRLKQAEQVFSLITDSSSGSVFNNNISTTLTARVFKGNKDITEKLPAAAFKWQRTSEVPTADSAWNSAHTGQKSIVITPSDVTGTVGIFDCIVEFDETKF